MPVLLCLDTQSAVIFQLFTYAGISTCSGICSRSTGQHCTVQHCTVHIPHYQSQARRNDFRSGAAVEGGGSVGPPPGKNFKKLKPIASISGHLVPFQCTVTAMKDFLILQKTKKISGYDRGQTLPSPGKKFKN